MAGQIPRYINSAEFDSLIAAGDVDQLIAVLKRGGTRALQMDAAVALGKLGNEKAIEPLNAIIENKYEWIGTRQKAILALGEIGGAAAQKILSQLTAYDDFYSSADIVTAIQTSARTALALLGE